MLSRFFQRLSSFIGVFFRTVRAIFTRSAGQVKSWVKRATNVSGMAVMAAGASVRGAATMVKKPSKREDYIETERFFISKSFLVWTVVILIAAALLCWFVLWPFVLSHFLTARFYQGDSRVPDWSGKVIVYYDKARTKPMYSGTLKDGVLQGYGKEYDEEGFVTYEGGFTDGVRNGSGTVFEAGAVVYEGQLKDGVYDGPGKLYEEEQLIYSGYFTGGAANGTGAAYRNGVKRYEGGFSDGIYHGEGVEYYESGAVSYKGSFSGGVYGNTGTAYYEDGTVKYKGSFSEGVYDGEGIAYYEDGATQYKGSFSDGLYDGSGTLFYAGGGVMFKGSFHAGLYEGDGTLYLPDGDSIHARFQNGTGDGVIDWYKNGRLWYSGEADDLTPNGFGTVYASGGKVIYTGRFNQGTLDGEWLLGLPADGLREAFGEASVTETDRNRGGFLIINNDLELTALCTYQSEGEDVQIHRIWFAPAAGADGSALLPWADRDSAEDWVVRDSGAAAALTRTQGSTFLPTGGVGGNWHQSVARFENCSVSLVCGGEASAPFEIIWALPGGTDVSGKRPNKQPSDGAGGRLDGILEALDGIDTSGSGGDRQNPGDVERLLSLMLTSGDAYELTDALINFYVYGQAVEALEENRPLLEKNLIDQQQRLSRGQGSQSAVDIARDQADALDRQIVIYRVEQEKARGIAENLTGFALDSYELSAALLVFDPTKADFQAMYAQAVEYAAGIASGRYEVDTGALEVGLRSLILDMSLAFENIRAAGKSLERCAASLETAQENYGTGSIAISELYDAQCAANEQYAQLIVSMGSFAGLANRLNDLSGGWVAREQGWFSEQFSVIFEHEIRMAQAEAEAEAEAEKQKEAEKTAPTDG